jgi:hypothetical protein
VKLFLWFLAIALIPTNFLEQGTTQESQGSRMTTLQQQIETGAVARVLIIHLPDSMMTRVAVDRAALLSMARSRFEIRTNIKDRLNPLFSRLSFQPEHQTPDLRWGIILYDKKSKEIGSLFVDKFGQYGYLDHEVGCFRTNDNNVILAAELHKLTGDLR